MQRITVEDVERVLVHGLDVDKKALRALLVKMVEAINELQETRSS